jgi:hypothetical protein
MTTIKSFVERLKKIGIDVELGCNYPWVYLEKINGKRVKEKFRANHGFTAFFIAIKRDDPHAEKITDISKIFKLIRRYL